MTPKPHDGKHPTHAHIAALVQAYLDADYRWELAGQWHPLPIGKVAHAAIKSKALKPQGEPGLNACVYYYPETVTWA